MPGRPHTGHGAIRLPIGEGQVRAYAVVLGPHPTDHPLLTLTVSVISGRDISANSAAVPLRYFADQLTAQFRKERAHQLALLHVRASTVAGHRLLSFRISYHFATVPLGTWSLYTQVVDAGGAFVLLVVRVFQPAFGPDTISTTALGHLCARLLAGLHL